jgi:hypothetical protein
MNFRRIATPIAFGTCILTIALSVIRTSEILGQDSTIKIGPDQSKASMAETLSWLKQRVPDLGTFTYESYKVTNTYDEGTNWPPKTTSISTTEVVQNTVVFKWNVVDRCEVKYQQRDDEIEIPLKDVDPASFAVIQTTKSMLFPRSPYWTLRMYTKGNHSYLGDSAKYKPIHVKHFGARPFETWMGSIQMILPDQESAERVGRALKHAAMLCGARVDPF